MSVADTGIGIPPADQARMFEKFERGVRQPGAGLGLSLVKSLIELHGGSVTIESASGCGTRITCQLPLSQQTAPGSAAADALASTGPAASATHAENIAPEDLRVPILA